MISAWLLEHGWFLEKENILRCLYSIWFTRVSEVLYHHSYVSYEICVAFMVGKKKKKKEVYLPFVNFNHLLICAVEVIFKTSAEWKTKPPKRRFREIAFIIVAYGNNFFFLLPALITACCVYSRI